MPLATADGSLILANLYSFLTCRSEFELEFGDNHSLFYSIILVKTAFQKCKRRGGETRSSFLFPFRRNYLGFSPLFFFEKNPPLFDFVICSLDQIRWIDVCLRNGDLLLAIAWIMLECSGSKISKVLKAFDSIHKAKMIFILLVCLLLFYPFLAYFI